MSSKKIKVNLYGGGPANLFLALLLSENDNYHITIFDQKKRIGSKFLVAGNGGFNLSHSENLADFIEKFRPVKPLKKAIQDFKPTDLQALLSSLKIETYIGSSNRIFPLKNIKPIEVLKKIKDRLQVKNVQFRIQQKFIGFSSNGVFIMDDNVIYDENADFHIFGLGGKSWSKTGSEGNWIEPFEKLNIEIDEILPSNCGLVCKIPRKFLEENAGTHIKNIAIRYKDDLVLGEFTITKYGIEGNAVYPLSGQVALDISKNESQPIFIDFKPMWSHKKLLKKLLTENGNSTKKLRNAGIPSEVIEWIKLQLSKEEWVKIEIVCQYLKAFQVDVARTRQIEESISTQGGIAINELTESFELKKRKNSYCIGEMVSWDAPTGGYLLHGCFAMGTWVAKAIMNKIH